MKEKNIEVIFQRRPHINMIKNFDPSNTQEKFWRQYDKARDYCFDGIPFGYKEVKQDEKDYLKYLSHESLRNNFVMYADHPLLNNKVFNLYKSTILIFDEYQKGFIK